MTWTSSTYSNRWGELEDFYQNEFNENKKMSNNLKAILGAVVSGVIVSVLGYLLSVGDIWKISLHSIVNIGVMAFAGSILKFMGTSKNDNFVGVVPLPPVTPTN